MRYSKTVQCEGVYAAKTRMMWDSDVSAGQLSVGQLTQRIASKGPAGFQPGRGKTNAPLQGKSCRGWRTHISAEAQATGGNEQRASSGTPVVTSPHRTSRCLEPLPAQPAWGCCFQQITTFCGERNQMASA